MFFGRTDHFIAGRWVDAKVARPSTSPDYQPAGHLY